MIFAGVHLGRNGCEEGELEGSLPNELTVHISNTWSVKPIPSVILLREKKRFHSSFGQCENLLAAAFQAAVCGGSGDGSWNGSNSGCVECLPAVREKPEPRKRILTACFFKTTA